MGITFDDDFENFLVKPLEKHREKNQKNKEDEIKKLVLEKTKQEKQVKDKKEINLLLVLQMEGKNQFNRVYNNIWEIKYLSTFENIENLKDLNDLYEYQNICLVHHGNIFSDPAIGLENRSELNSDRIKNISKVINTISEIPNEFNNEYVKLVHEKSKLFFKDGIKEIYIKSFLSLRLLIENLQESGNFFSVACNEADDENFLVEISNFTNKNVKLFANSNFSVINDNSDLLIGTILIENYYSILNTYLSSNWKDPSGWKYYDTKTKKIVITKKDLWLNSYNKTKIYELISRGKVLTKEQINKENYAKQYFSKVFEKKYIQIWGKESFKSFKSKIELKYTDFKRP